MCLVSQSPTLPAFVSWARQAESANSGGTFGAWHGAVCGCWELHEGDPAEEPQEKTCKCAHVPAQQSCHTL